MRNKSIKIGICGLGTVGSGTFNVLQNNCKEISRRLGCELSVEQIASRRDNPASDTSLANITRDIFEVVQNPAIDIVVELIGGVGSARDLVLQAIDHGKHVVTANKALIAEHGNEIFAAAQEKGIMVAYEASVAGGIPVIKAIREGLAANQINWIAGIINGTGNFIMSEMREKGRIFHDVLSEAQQLGYAEADPTFDVEGIDAAHKLAILASISFGIPLQFKKVYTEGISKITTEDVSYAEELGYRIKHLGITRRLDHGVELRVHPTLVSEKHLLANVEGVMNAVLMHGDAVGSSMYYGQGAGANPTASAVVADIIDLARTIQAPTSATPYLGFQPDKLSDLPVLPIEEVVTAYYLRISALDRAGVMAQITQILSGHDINIEAIIQKEPTVYDENTVVPVIMLTHEVKERKMINAIQQIEAAENIIGHVARIRVERFKHD